MDGEILIIGESRFDLGQVVATTALIDWAESHGVDLAPLLARHARGDWGDLCESDWEQNESALTNEDNRLFSSYEIPEVDQFAKVWVITEWDRSVTTLLRPDDY